MPLTIPDYIKVKNPTGGTVAYLSPKSDGIKEVWPDTQLNGPSTLELSLPLGNEKWEYLTDDCRIVAGGREYIFLKPDAIEVSRDGHKLWGKIMAQESWIMLNKKYATISNDPANPDPP